MPFFKKFLEELLHQNEEAIQTQGGGGEQRTNAGKQERSLRMMVKSRHGSHKADIKDNRSKLSRRTKSSRKDASKTKMKPIG